MQGCWASQGCDLTEGKGEEVRDLGPLPRPPTHLVWMGGQKALGPLLSLLTLRSSVQTSGCFVSCLSH